MAGGNGRVLDDGDDPRRPTARLAKDVWVLGADRAAPIVVAAAPAGRPRVVRADARRRRDVLARAGGRARRGDRQDGTRDRLAPPDRSRRWRRSTADAGHSEWPTSCASCAARRSTPNRSTGRPIVVLDAELVAATRAVSEQLTAMLAEAATVAEYLSVTAGRVLAQHGRVAQRVRRRAGGHRRPRRVHRRPGRVRRAVGREHGARPGVALRRPRPPHRALVRGARPRRRMPAPPLPTPADRPAACSSRPATSSTGPRWRCCWRRTRASSPTAGTTAATSSRRRPRTCCCTTSTTRARTSPRSAASPSTSRRSTGPRAARPSPSSPDSSTTTTCSPASARPRPQSRRSARSSSRRGSRRRSTRPWSRGRIR